MSRLQPATIEDVHALCSLETDLFPDNCFNETTLSNELVQGRGWVYQKSGKIVGYIIVQSDGLLEDIIRLGVDRNHWGTGIGTKLLRKALDEKSLPAILTVTEDNKRALRLYLRNGFRVVGKLPEGAWVLQHD